MIFCCLLLLLHAINSLILGISLLSLLFENPFHSHFKRNQLKYIFCDLFFKLLKKSVDETCHKMQFLICFFCILLQKWNTEIDDILTSDWNFLMKFKFELIWKSQSFAVSLVSFKISTLFLSRVCNYLVVCLIEIVAWITNCSQTSL